MTQLQKRSFDFHIVLLEPEIPQNTGAIGRLCVATETTLHLIEPLGFSIDEKEVRREGLDYWKHVKLIQHKSFGEFKIWCNQNVPTHELFFMETGRAKSLYHSTVSHNSVFIFGQETKGIPFELLEENRSRVFDIPMFSESIRSLNLANTVSIVLYEGIRQSLLKNSDLI